MGRTKFLAPVESRGLDEAEADEAERTLRGGGEKPYCLPSSLLLALEVDFRASG